MLFAIGARPCHLTLFCLYINCMHAIPNAVSVLICLVSLYVLIKLCLIDSTAQAVSISIRMEPDTSPKCPGDTVTLYCNHTRTSHNPGWRVRGNGLPQFGFAQFGVEPLVGHSLEQSDLVEEILTIATVQHKFDGFTYTCLYSILGKDVISNPPVVLQVISTYIV